MHLAAATLAFAAPLAFAQALPGEALRLASTFPEQQISRATSEHEWPFSVDAGTLTCISLGGRMTVFFAEPWREDVPQELGNMTLPRMVVVSANPLALLASFEDRALYLPFDTLETLVGRLAPFEEMGLALCDEASPQPDEL